MYIIFYIYYYFLDPLELQAGSRYASGLRVLEGLSASGLRSVRFGLEIPGLKEVIANDFDATAVEYIKRNISHNKISDLVTPSHDDACMVMYKEKRSRSFERFDVVDLDPYGSPSIFLDAAVQSVSDGGILCVTSTDMAVLCGNAPETCHSKYGSLSLRTKYCHEMALRIMLRSIDSHANRYQRYIEPLLSLSIDFYCRVFVRVFTGQKYVKRSCTRLSRVLHCIGCGTFELQPIATRNPTSADNYKYTVTHITENTTTEKQSVENTSEQIQTQHIKNLAPRAEGDMRCHHCRGRRALIGPLWNDKLHDRTYVETLLEEINKNEDKFQTSSRMKGMLTVALEELDCSPLYYHVDELCRVLHCTPPTLLQIRYCH